MFRWCWWNRSPYMLLNCWPIVIFAQSVLYCQDYTFNGCRGRANGCEKSAKCARGEEKECRGRVRVRREQVVVGCVGWGRKWVRLAFLSMALTPTGRRRAARFLPLQGIARGGGRFRN